MNHLLVHINQDIKGDETKIRTQRYIEMNTRTKEMQQFNKCGPERDTIKPSNASFAELSLGF